MAHSNLDLNLTGNLWKTFKFNVHRVCAASLTETELFCKEEKGKLCLLIQSWLVHNPKHFLLLKMFFKAFRGLNTNADDIFLSLYNYALFLLISHIECIKVCV
ncbi:hypothetical protein ATANTOWER_010964 [Ataeniobius toweri]|uniref:Uncharacterized protein n=1 Tax=Ataeniobius toweri TaxID=208326 RepID=A0ABU7BZN0_9TELE|nr:hypothetical protein [Ataeniobius toweri]